MRASTHCQHSPCLGCIRCSRLRAWTALYLVMRRSTWHSSAAGCGEGLSKAGAQLARHGAVSSQEAVDVHWKKGWGAVGVEALVSRQLQAAQVCLRREKRCCHSCQQSSVRRTRRTRINGAASDFQTTSLALQAWHEAPARYELQMMKQAGWRSWEDESTTCTPNHDGGDSDR